MNASTLTRRAALTLAALGPVLLSAPAQADPPGGTGGWTQTFDEEFNDSSIDSGKWITTLYWGGTTNNSDDCYFDPANNWEYGNVLTQQMTQYGAGGKQRGGATLETFGKFTQTYGYYEARIQDVGGGPGTGYSFFLLDNAHNWPPEIDIMEAPGL